MAEPNFGTTATHEFYADFFADMFPKVLKFIRARFPSDLAEDLTSETLLTLWRKQLPPPSDEVGLRQLRRLTYKIALGHVLNAARQDRRQDSRVGDPTMQIRPTVDPTFEAVVPLVVRRAIAELEFNDRQALNLLLVGFRTSEIADILGITPKAASMRLARARERLTQQLKDRKEDVDGADV